MRHRARTTVIVRSHAAPPTRLRTSRRRCPCCAANAPAHIETANKSGVINLCNMHLDMPDHLFDAIPGTACFINISSNRFTYLDNRICDYVLVLRLIATFTS